VCLAGYFSDVQGDSNDPCIADGTAVMFADVHTCIDSSGCTTEFQSCVGGVCAYPNKTCVADCSGHGDCVFLTTGLPSVEQELLDECPVLDSRCVAMCLCEDKYSVNTICSASPSEVESRQLMRSRSECGDSQRRGAA
jgi:hypothetical protein